MWSIVDATSPVYQTLREIAVEEMYHFAYACNMLVSLTDDRLEMSDFLPTYPAHLPGGARPLLEVSLRKCDKWQIEKFADIESFDSGGCIDTIGEFYAALQASFVEYIQECNPVLDTRRQEASWIFKIESKEDVEKAIDIITGQGEGKPRSNDPRDPTDPSKGLAHYFQFKELEFGLRYKEIGGKWQFDNSDPVAMPATFDMADIPTNGYDENILPANARDSLLKFRTAYAEVLTKLASVWNEGADLSDAIYYPMFDMTTHARALMQIDIGAGLGTYGPDFKL